jgi:hypothetical protein
LGFLGWPLLFEFVALLLLLAVLLIHVGKAAEKMSSDLGRYPGDGILNILLAG